MFSHKPHKTVIQETHTKLTSNEPRLSVEGPLVGSSFPSKIVLCSHTYVPTVFPYLFPLNISAHHLWVRARVSCSCVHVPLFPTIFFLCFLVPSETLSV